MAKDYRERPASERVHDNVMIMRLVRAILVCSLAFASAAAAQTFDSSGFDNSGNDLLKGTYYFRETVWILSSNGSGNLSDAGSIYGNIIFDGNGNYTLSGASLMDAAAGAPQAYSHTGTYTISTSGYGYLSSPAFNGDSIYGLVTQGIFIGSATENGNGYNNLFIAAPVGSPVATVATLKGAYMIADLDNPTGNALDARDSLIQFTADGVGGIGTVNVSGYIGINGNTAVRQSIGGVRYTFSNGAGNIPLSSPFTQSNLDTKLVGGTYYLYISPDGNFVFGGSPTGWDMFVGVRVSSGAPSFNGLYYQAGMDLDVSNLASGSVAPDSFYGTLKAIPSISTILAHQRLLSLNSSNPYDFTFDDSFSLKSDGTYDDSSTHYF